MVETFEPGAPAPDPLLIEIIAANLNDHRLQLAAALRKGDNVLVLSILRECTLGAPVQNTVPLSERHCAMLHRFCLETLETSLDADTTAAMLEADASLKGLWDTLLQSTGFFFEQQIRFVKENTAEVQGKADELGSSSGGMAMYNDIMSQVKQGQPESFQQHFDKMDGLYTRVLERVRGQTQEQEICRWLDRQGKDPVPLQRDSDVFAVHAAGHGVLPKFKAFVGDITARIDGSSFETGPRKKMWRSLEKCGVTRDVQSTLRDGSKLIDIVRGTVNMGSQGFSNGNSFLDYFLGCDKYENSDYQGAGFAAKHGQVVVVGVKNKWKKPAAGGWCCGQLYFYFTSDPQQHICELQMVHSRMQTARKDIPNQSYEAYSRNRCFSELLSVIAIKAKPPPLQITAAPDSSDDVAVENKQHGATEVPAPPRVTGVGSEDAAHAPNQRGTTGTAVDPPADTLELPVVAQLPVLNRMYKYICVDKNKLGVSHRRSPRMHDKVRDDFHNNGVRPGTLVETNHPPEMHDGIRWIMFDHDELHVVWLPLEIREDGATEPIQLFKQVKDQATSDDDVQISGASYVCVNAAPGSSSIESVAFRRSPRLDDRTDEGLAPGQTINTKHPVEPHGNMQWIKLDHKTLWLAWLPVEAPLSSNLNGKFAGADTMLRLFAEVEDLDIVAPLDADQGHSTAGDGSEYVCTDPVGVGIRRSPRLDDRSGVDLYCGQVITIKHPVETHIGMQWVKFEDENLYIAWLPLYAADGNQLFKAIGVDQLGPVISIKDERHPDWERDANHNQCMRCKQSFGIFNRRSAFALHLNGPLCDVR